MKCHRKPYAKEARVSIYTDQKYPPKYSWKIFDAEAKQNETFVKTLSCSFDTLASGNLLFKR